MVCAQTSIPQKNAGRGLTLMEIERRIERSDFSGLDRQLMDLAIANPSNVKALELLAGLRLRQGRLAESRALYQRVLGLDPSSARAKITIARIAFVTGQTDEASQLLGSVDQGMTLTPEFRLELAAAYLLIGDAPAAASVAELLPANVRNTAALPLLGEIYLRLNRKDAFGSLIPLMKRAAPGNASLALKCAEVLRHARMIKEAHGLLMSLPRTARNNVKVLLALSRLEMMAGAPAKAREHLKQAAMTDPKSAEVLSLRAYVESESGNKDIAIAMITRAREAAPSSPAVLADFVALTLRIGKPVLAYEAAQTLTELAPEDGEFQYLLGVAALQSGNLVPAQTTLERYVLAQPSDFRGCLALGMVFTAQRGQTERARSQLARCSEIDPSNTEARYQLALLNKSQGENEQAIRLLEEVIERVPGYAAALRDLGALYLESGNDEKARGFLERAAALIPKDGETHFQLVRLYNRIGETALAKQHQEIFQKLRGPWGKSAQ